jgi:hypothetical protein
LPASKDTCYLAVSRNPPASWVFRPRFRTYLTCARLNNIPFLFHSPSRRHRASNLITPPVCGSSSNVSQSPPCCPRRRHSLAHISPPMARSRLQTPTSAMLTLLSPASARTRKPRGPSFIRTYGPLETPRQQDASCLRRRSPPNGPL